MAKPKCATHRLFLEPCPKCGRSDEVYVGHGIVRFCAHCVISWDVSEVMDIQTAVLEGKLRADTPPIVDSTQERIITDIQATANEIKKAAGMDERISKLLDIPDEKWEGAEAKSA